MLPSSERKTVAGAQKALDHKDEFCTDQRWSGPRAEDSDQISSQQDLCMLARTFLRDRTSLGADVPD